MSKSIADSDNGGDYSRGSRLPRAKARLKNFMSRLQSFGEDNAEEFEIDQDM